MTLDTKFAAQVRAQLVDTAAGSSALAKRTHRTRVGIGLAAGAAAAVLLTAGAVVVVNSIPGNHAITILGPVVTGQYTGTAIVELGDRPDGANAVKATITCTSEGTISIDNGSMTCDDDASSVYFDDDASTVYFASDGVLLSPIGNKTYLQDLLLPDGATSFTVTADPGMTWTITARYVHTVTTDWAVNANGQTYGVPNEKGIPDLYAVGDLEGNVAFVYSADEWVIPTDFPADPTQEEIDAWNELHAHDVTRIPAYESDGVTVVGEWVIGGDDAGLKLLP